MKINLVGGSNQERSLPLDSERTINLYAVSSPGGKESSALYGTMGLSLFSTCGVGAVRGGYASSNGRVFFVSSSGLYELTSAGVSTLRGTLDSSSGNVTLDENGFQLAICDGTSLYTFIYSSNTFAKVTDVDLPSCGGVTFIDGYFVVNKNNSGSFYISALYDGNSWTSTGFATAESSPDNLLRAILAVGQLWLFGYKTTEIWTNTGASAFPFERISGAKMEVGILAPYTALPLDNSIFWVGRDDKGAGVVYRANGFTPLRISTNAIELLIQTAPTPETLSASTYQREGHVFYQITGGGMATTLVYDVSTKLWFEKARLNEIGEYEQHLSSCIIYGFNKLLAGSRLNGKIYEMSPNYYDDDGEAISSERIYTHISDEDKRLKFSELIIDMETGVGVQHTADQDLFIEMEDSGFIEGEDDTNFNMESSRATQGANPLITLWISRDGGRTYSGGYTTSFGAIGKYKTRARFSRLGYAFDWTFKIRITDPVKRVLIGSYLK